MGNTFYFQWEFDLMEWLQAVLGEAGVSVVSLFSMFGENLLIIVIMGFLYWSWDKKAGEYVGTMIAVNLLWNPLIKNLTLRRRPYMDDPDIICYRPVDKEASIYDLAKQGYSFPSGHSSISAAGYGAMANYFRKNWLTAACIVIPFLVGISRFCVGVHYPTDVLGGWLLGVVIVAVISWLRKKLKSRAVLYAILVLTSLPGIFYCTSTDYFTGLGMMIGFFAAILFENKYVKFENTRRPLAMVLRVLGGIVVYFVLGVLLKLPFSAEFLESESAACFAVRVIRYAIMLFAEIGVYPMLFKTKVLK